MAWQALTSSSTRPPKGSSTRKSSMARPPGCRSTTSTETMSPPARPRALATVPSAPGWSGSAMRNRCTSSILPWRHRIAAHQTCEPSPTEGSIAVSAITRAEVAQLARLARIDLTDAELDHLAPQLDDILQWVAKIKDVAAADIPPTSHPLPLTNVFRPDE